MSETRNDPQDPQAWIARAESSLARSRIGHGVEHVVLDDLVFDAHQAALEIAEHVVAWVRQQLQTSDDAS